MLLVFFVSDSATTAIYTNLNTLSLHDALPIRSEEHTSELQSHSEISYAVFCLKKKKKTTQTTQQFMGYGVKSISISLSCIRAKWFLLYMIFCFFFFNDTATTEIYTNLNTLSLHDALPIYSSHIQKSRMPSSACDWS